MRVCTVIQRVCETSSYFVWQCRGRCLGSLFLLFCPFSTSHVKIVPLFWKIYPADLIYHCITGPLLYYANAVLFTTWFLYRNCLALYNCARENFPFAKATSYFQHNRVVFRVIWASKPDFDIIFGENLLLFEFLSIFCRKNFVNVWQRRDSNHRGHPVWRHISSYLAHCIMKERLLLQEE